MNGDDHFGRRDLTCQYVSAYLIDIDRPILYYTVSLVSLVFGVRKTFRRNYNRLSFIKTMNAMNYEAFTVTLRIKHPQLRVAQKRKSTQNSNLALKIEYLKIFWKNTVFSW